MFRGAISGFGKVAALGHLPGWRSRSDVRIVAVHDPVPARRHEALRQIKGVRVYEEIELMLAAERIDFLDIASPPNRHIGATLAALEAGAHVLVEKPLCLKLDDFERIALHAVANRRVLQCVHNWKYAPAYRLAQNLIENDRLGDLRYIALNRLRTQPAGEAAWRRDPAVGGGGILVDHGWHLFYLMPWLYRGNLPKTVNARLWCQDGSQVEDVADLRVEFSTGRIGCSHLSWRAPVRLNSALMYGDKALLQIENDRALLVESDKSQKFEIADMPDDSYHSAWFAEVAQDFLNAVATGPACASAVQNLTETRIAVALIEAAKESASQSGASVAIRLNL